MVKFVLFLCAGFLNFLNAQIPAVAFKEVTKYFKDPHYSPLMGRVALDSGYIYNLRHFGLFTPAVAKNADGTVRRLYDSDTPNDAMMALLITLFPSSAGPLASESMAISNFGKNAKIEDVAKMLQFAKAVRAVISESSHLQNDPESMWGLTKILDQYKDLGKMRSLIVQSIRLEYNANNKKRDGQRAKKQKNYKMWMESATRPMDDEAIERADITQAERSQRMILKDQENQAQQKISNDENRLYPLYTTEQIILSFFVHKFNNKEDIYELMKALGDDFITNPIVSTPHESEIWDRDNVHTYADTKDLDYIFITTHHDLNAPIPFKNGNTPISNGICPKINIVNGEKEITHDVFADCHETALRQLCSIGFYDAESKAFKIPKTISNTYFRDFFDKQTPLEVSDGSSEMRGLWNLVIGGLPGVRYRQGINEIDSGYINLIKAMRLVLDIENDTLPKDKDEVIAALKDIFKTMNPDLKDIHIYISDFSSHKDGYKGIDDDFYGDATITITNAYGQTFSFVLRQDPGHADIQKPTWQKMKIPLPDLIKREDPILSLIDRRDIKTGIYQLLAEEEFADTRQRIKRIKDFSPHVKQQYIPIIDRMMNLDLLDENTLSAAIEALTPLVQNNFMFPFAVNIALFANDDTFLDLCLKKSENMVFKQFKKEGQICLSPYRLSKFSTILPDFKTYLVDINNIRGTFDILDLSQSIKLKEISILSDATIGTLILPPSPALKEISLQGKTTIEKLDLSQATNLEVINIGENTTIGTLIPPPSPALKGISLQGKTTIEKLDLSQATNLEVINIGENTTIGTLIPPPSPALREISLQGKTTIEKLDLSQATNLEVIYIGPETKIGTLILPNSPALQEIRLQGKTTIEKLDLSQATNLEVINIGLAVNIGMLTFPNSPSLKKIDLNGNITTEHLDLSQATNLNRIYVGANPKIGTLTLPNSPSLKYFTLKGIITTADLDLRQYTNLETISIDGNANIGNLTLPNSPSLKYFTLSGNITMANLDLSQYTNLERINIEWIAGTIGTLTLPNLPLLNTISLFGNITHINAYRHQESLLKYKIKGNTTVTYLDDRDAGVLPPP
ncbi:MAG: hypothetical protein NEHIOOID_00080 [Holosporales bacterium]